MEERNDRKNTMLLTVIAIATLLVAVIGATFAYFTATIQNRETASTVIVGGSTLEIRFADGSSTLQTPENLNPVKQVSGSYAPVVTKVFTLTGTNTTGQGTTEANSAKVMPYDLYLIVENNTFQLMNYTTNKTALTYKLTPSNNSEGIIPISSDFTNIPATEVAAASACTKCGTVTTGEYGQTYDKLQTVAMGTVDVYGDGNSTTPVLDDVQGLKLGHGYFPASGSTIDHTYTLTIYFNETGNNQDFDKNKEFAAYVAISTGNLAIETTDTAVNSGNA